jgi:hypothetical protein
VRASTELVMKRVRLVAGAGRDAPTAAPAESNGPSTPDIAGNNATSGPGFQRECVCTVHGKTRGAIGGYTGSLPTADTGATGYAEPAAPPMGIRDGVGGGSGCTPPAHDGASGQAQTAGVAAPSYGTVDGSGFRPSTGGPGLAGNPGQGGGGGGRSGAAGGGGGCGGCGGGGGRGGASGGASIGLLTVGTPVRLIECAIVTSRGGAGGAGSAGEDGRIGGPGGSGGCFGGKGGPGAGGSGGAGGAGGLSVGVLFEDPQPLWNGSKLEGDANVVAGIEVGAAGSAGQSGAGGKAAPEPDATAGLRGADGLAGLSRASLRRR